MKAVSIIIYVVQVIRIQSVRKFGIFIEHFLT